MISTTVVYILLSLLLTIAAITAGYTSANKFSLASFSGGTLGALALLLLIPTALPKCAAVVTVSAMILGLIVAVFIGESVKRNHFADKTVVLFTCNSLLLGGFIWWGLPQNIGLCIGAYYLCVGILLQHSHSPKRAFFLIPASLGVGFVLFSLLPPLTQRWQGMLLALSAGITLMTAAQSFDFQDQQTALPFCLGIAAGLSITLL